MEDEPEHPRRAVPVYDGNPSKDPAEISVLLPTRANIEALRDQHSYVTAFRLQRSGVCGQATVLLGRRGVAVSTQELERRMGAGEIGSDEADIEFVDQILAEAGRKLASGDLALDADVGQSLEILRHYRNLTDTLAELQDDERTAALWAASVLSASSIGFAVAQVWGSALGGEFPRSEAVSLPASGGRARAIQKAWWWAQGLARCREKRSANPATKTAALVTALKLQFRPLLVLARDERPEGQRDLPTTDGGWRSAVERWEATGELPRRISAASQSEKAT